VCGDDRFQDRGIIPRAISAAFAEVRKRSSQRYKVFISFMEVYNENVYDLLDPSNQDRPIEAWTRVQLIHGESSELHLRNLSVYEVTDEEESLSLLFLGTTNRRTSETTMNQVHNASPMSSS
jgi:kinesin family protein 6/9